MDFATYSQDACYLPTTKRAREKVTRVLGWCDENLYYDTPVAISSAELSKVFGQGQHRNTQWLRSNLLVQSTYYSPGTAFCRYSLRDAGMTKLKAILGVTTPNLSDNERYWRKFGAELGTLNFVYSDTSHRLWHPLQNMKRDKKEEFWKDLLPRNYDIDACAPNLLMQTGLMMNATNLSGVCAYLENKHEFRAHVARITGTDVDTAKRIINGLFNGARLTPHFKCSIFRALENNKGVDNSRDALAALAADRQVIALRKSIAEIWKVLKIEDDEDSRWQTYFRLERQVIDVAHTFLNSMGNRFFSEHDGWRCEREVDTNVLTSLITKQTGYNLTFSSN